MGSVLGAVANPVVSQGGSLFGNNPITQALGLSGEQGQYFSPQDYSQQSGTNLSQLLHNNQEANNVTNSSQLNDLLQGYGSGTKTSAQALSDISGQFEGPQKAQAYQDFLTNGLSGSKYATEQVQNNDILGQLYGKGGTLDQTVQRQNDLANRGFSLQPEDHEAYGQASGNIARMFGQNEQNLAQSLADRGLSQGPNGATAASFSGLQGNKNEQLAQAQMNIANQRMQSNLDRLNSTQNFLNQLSGGASSAINDQFSRNLAGAKNYQDQNNSAIQNAQNKYNSDISKTQSENSANLASMQDQRASAGKTLLQGLGQGLFGSSVAVGNAPGQIVGGAAGGAGTGLGMRTGGATSGLGTQNYANATKPTVSAS